MKIIMSYSLKKIQRNSKKIQTIYSYKIKIKNKKYFFFKLIPLLKISEAIFHHYFLHLL